MLSEEYMKEERRVEWVGVEGMQDSRKKEIKQLSVNPKVVGVGHMNLCRLDILPLLSQSTVIPMVL